MRVHKIGYYPVPIGFGVYSDKHLNRLTPLPLQSNPYASDSSLLVKMKQPNDEDPLNHEAAAVLRENPKLFESNVRRAMSGGYVGQTYFPRYIS